MTANASQNPQHADLVQERAPGPPSSNPLANAPNVTVSVPESVEIRLVDASTLNDYEIWFLISGILGSAAVGFLVAYFQAAEGTGGSLLATAVVFGVLLLVAVGNAIYKRWRLTHRTRKVRFRIGQPIDD